MRLVVALLLAACGGSKQKQVDHKQACAEAARTSVDAMLNEARGRLADPQISRDARAQVAQRTEDLEVLAPRQRAVMANRCVDDRWSSEVVACYTKTGSLDDVRACRKQLTAEQRAALQKDELQLLAGPSGPPGFVGSASAPRDPRLTELLRERNELMKQLAAGSNTDAQLRARIDVLSAKITALEKP